MSLSWIMAPSTAKSYERESDERMKLWQSALNQMAEFRSQQDIDLRGGSNLYDSALKDIGGGFDAALRAASLSGRSSRTAAKEGGLQQGAAMKQSMVSRGLYGTTALDNAQRGINSDTSRRLQEIDESVASLVGQLSVGKGQAIAGAKMGKAGFGAQASQIRQNSLENYLNLLRDKPVKFNKSAYMQQTWNNAETDSTSMVGSFFGGMGG